MKRLYIVFFVSAMFIIISLFLNFNTEKDKSSSVNDDVSAMMTEKQQWEYLRLRDPMTGKIPSDIRRRELEYASKLPGSINNIRTKYDRKLSTRWTPRGPINVGGRTRALGVDVTDENVIIAGGVSGGIWRSTDGGKNWNVTTRPEQLQSTSCLIQDTRQEHENTWYCGTGEYFNIYGGVRGDGIYKSTDKGLTWNLLESTISNTPNSWDSNFDYIWNIVVNHTNTEQDEVIAATAVGAIKRSTDGGNTWKTVLGGFGNTSSWFSDIAISPSGIMYATMSQKTFGDVNSSVKGIYRSTDGTNWTDITPSTFPEKYWRVVIGIAPSDENQVYFLAETPGSGKVTFNWNLDSNWHSFYKYTFLSGDGSGEGGKWEDRSESIPKPENIRLQFKSQGSYDLVVAVKPDDPEVVIIGGTSLYRSTDGMKTVENVKVIGGYNPYDSDDRVNYYQYPVHHPDLHAITFLPSNPNVMFSGSDGGVHKTYNCLADSVAWEDLNIGYITTQFYTVGIDHATQGSEEIIGGLQDNGTRYTNSLDINKYWTFPNASDGFYSLIQDGGGVYYVSQNSSYQPKHKIYRIQLDKDGYRTTRTRLEPIGARDLAWVNPFILDPNNQNRMYFGGGQILWRQNDLSKIPFEDSNDSLSTGWDSLTYTRYYNKPEETYLEKISAIDVSTKPANIVYYGTAGGRLFRLDNAHEGDPEPVELTENIFQNNTPNISCIAINPDNAAEVFVTVSNYSVVSVYHSSNSGSDWENISGNLEELESGGGAGPAVNWIEMLEVKGKKMYFVATSTGVYSTAYLDGKYTVWTQEGAETLGNNFVYMLDSRKSDGFIVAATHGNGMYSAFITELPPKPGKTSLISPENNKRGVQKSVSLRWENVADAGLYHLIVARDQNFQDILLDYDGYRNTSFEMTNLEVGYKQYYWKVITRGSGGITESDVWTFTTVLSDPDLVYPDNGATSIPTTFSLLWDEVTGAKYYHIQISKSFGFSNNIVDTTNVLTNSLEISGLENNQKYYWRVSAIDDDAESAFSEQRFFRTEQGTGVNEQIQAKGLTRIESIYPNPAINETNIKFYCDYSQKVIIEIFDENGKKVLKSYEGTFNKGLNTFKLNTAILRSGIYYCRLKFEKGESAKHFVVVR